MTWLGGARHPRAVGGLVIVAVFAAGVAAGLAWSRPQHSGINLNVRLTTALPGELRRLDLSPVQEDSLRQVLSAGQVRMQRVLSDLEPRLRAVIDSVDADVRAVLTPEQRTRWRAAWRDDRRDQVEIDTVRPDPVGNHNLPDTGAIKATPKVADPRARSRR